MGKIFASDWNPLQTTVANIMGAPNGVSYGWNQAGNITSSQVNSTLQINHTHYNALKADIDFCYGHIANTASSLATRNAGTQITQADLTNVSAAVTYISNNKQSAATANLTQSNIYSNTQAYTWSSQLGATYTLTWTNATEFNAFFNAGGSISFNLSRYAGATNSQNQSWTNLLSNMGFVYIKGSTSGQTGQTWTGTTNISSGISGFTTSAQQMLIVYDQDSGYTSNYVKISCYLDAAVGTARQLSIVVLLADAHTGAGGSPDTVDGNVAVTITQRYPYTYGVLLVGSSNGILV